MGPRLNGATVVCLAQLVAVDAAEQMILGGALQPVVQARGCLTPAELEQIMAWKYPPIRGKHYAAQNGAAKIKALTRQVFGMSDATAAVRKLCELRGVQVRMASAILTAFDPERYTVLDKRVWTALRKLGLLEPLGLATLDRADNAQLDQPEVYEAYLNACRRLAAAANVPLRTLDRCLWTIDKLNLYTWALQGVSFESILIK